MLFPVKQNAGVAYEKQRHTWCLLKRVRPHIPCPENTPLPSSKLSSEQRSIIYSVYFRYWTFFPEEASDDVVHIKALNLTKKQLNMQKVEIASHRAAWKDFLQRVPPTSFQGIRNFMMACIAEGRNFDRSDTLQDGASRGLPVTCSITLTDVDNSFKVDDSSAPIIAAEESAQSRRHKLYMCSQLHTAIEIMQIQEEKGEATSHLKKKLRRASQQQLNMSDFTTDHASQCCMTEPSGTSFTGNPWDPDLFHLTHCSYKVIIQSGRQWFIYT